MVKLTLRIVGHTLMSTELGDRADARRRLLRQRVAEHVVLGGRVQNPAVLLHLGLELPGSKIIIGDGPDRAALEATAQQWRIADRVTFTGNLPQTVAGKAWMKRVLHLGGGDLQIQGLIRDHLEHLGDQLAGSAFGAEVISFYKTSSEPVQLSISGQLLGYINSGKRMLTFFGHSGGNTFDFSLDDPETYANADRYPFILSPG